MTYASSLVQAMSVLGPGGIPLRPIGRGGEILTTYRSIRLSIILSPITVHQNNGARAACLASYDGHRRQ